jgi:D-alanyl-D-alanine carboxypeptidase/D-alanyl-D-alanine-endopeptidase (penicillin-binding protein 4)
MVRGSVPDPEKNVADLFSGYIKEKGIELSGEVIPFRTAKVNPPDYDNLKILYSVAGRSVKEIIEWTNLKSVNFFAEGLLKGVAFKLTGKGTHENGIQVYRQYLSQRIDTSGLVLYDGSGLSRMNRISASHMFELLRYINGSSFAQDFKQTLPVAGKTGTIRDLCVGQIGEGRVYAKSGTMTGIKSYAGYIDAVSGKKIAFSLVASDYSCSQSVVKTYMESLFNGLAGL